MSTHTPAKRTQPQPRQMSPISFESLAEITSPILELAKGYPIQLVRQLSSGEVDAIDTAVGFIEDALGQKASAEEIADAFRLLSGGMGAKVSDAEYAAKAYLIALSMVSSYALREAVRLFLTGEGGKFMPTAPEIAMKCSGIDSNLKAKLDGLRKIQHLNAVALPKFTGQGKQIA